MLFASCGVDGHVGISLRKIDGIPISRYWLIPYEKRPKLFTPHPTMTSEELRVATQGVWDSFYSAPEVWKRSSCATSIKARLAFFLISKLYRQMYANTGIATDSARRNKATTWARVLAKQTRKLFVAKPMPDNSIQMALDLKNAAVTIKDLGITKAAGVAGSAQAAIKQTGDRVDISQIEVAFGEVKLDGSVGFDVKKGLQSAEFSTFALSPDDDAQLSLSPVKGGYQVKLSGNQLDLKPMFKRFFSLGGDSTGGPQATAVKQTIVADIELKRALGFFKTTAFNVNLDLSLNGADLKNVNLQANLGGDRSVSVTTNASPDGKVMSVAFNDLGTVLRLLGVYPNVEGGEGSLVVATNDAQKIDSGQFVLRNFAFVNEANVAQILGNHRESQALIAKSNKLEFKSGEVEFVRRSDRVEITDAVLAGATVGGTARGFIYTDKRQYDIAGTYVPLFGLNNAFAKLLGPFAGRKNEGLFGVTFAIRGPLDKPEFKINPMSALVPGAFRRMFEYRAKEIPRVE